MIAVRPRRIRSVALVAGIAVVVVAAIVTVLVPLSRSDQGSAPVARPGGAATAVAASAVTVRRYDYLADALGTPLMTSDTSQNYGDLFLPPGRHADDSLPLVVLVHGGGWSSRYGATTFDPLARTLAARGVAVYNIEYRRLGSGGGWPTTFTDVAAAVDFVPTLDRENPEIDTADSTLVGHSAGAQLAVWAGTRDRPGAVASPTPRWQPSRIISLAGPLNLRLAADTGDTRVTRILGGTPAQVPDRYRTVDPIENIDPAMPITVVHGTADTVVSPTQSETFVNASDRARGRARLVLLAGQSHSALVSPRSTAFPRVVDLIVAATRPAP